MTRFQKLAAATVVTVFILVTIGVIVRVTDSGLACPTWPGCFDGQFLPGLDDNYQVWLEWIHRSVAVVIGFQILGLAYLALRDHRDRRALVVGSLVAVGLVAFQAWLGRETVRLGNSGESVTAHLAAAMALTGLLIALFVRAGYPARLAGGGRQRLTALAAFAAVAVYALLLFGAHVTATDQGLVYPDWPLMGGSLLPPLTEAGSAQVLHRWVAIVVGLVVAALVVAVWRTARDRPILVRLAVAAAILYPLQSIVGGLQILTRLDGWTQVLHVSLAALVFGALVALAVASFCEARLAVATAEAGSGAGAGAGGRPDAPGAIDGGSRGSGVGDTVRAYVALTKPRIIELLLVTTVPAMVLATREVPGIVPLDFAWLVGWTLVCGTLAAGAANAINQVIDRDIDELMARTRRRPLPAHRVEPEQALIFGLVLGVISVGLMAYTVNLVAAFLTLLAIGFYVVIYSMILKRSTPQNIVIGGAAGALPPVIGWAAVTGEVGVPALLLFALVFYWTPPHFWALALRIRRDYEAARVPMLPVVRGVAETTRQIWLYAILMVAISLIFAAVAQMGWLYLGAAVILGAVFLWQAYRLWRRGGGPEEVSTAGAIRLYRYSISYLTLLFLAVAVDALVLIPV